MPKKFAKFAAIGVFNTLFNLFLFNIFIFAGGLHTLAANVLSVVISIIISFFLNSKLVFKNHSLDIFHSTFAKFLIVTLITQLVIQQLVLLFFLDIFKFPGHLAFSIGHKLPGGFGFSKLFYDANTAKVLAVGVSLVANFVAYERYVFNQKADAAKADADYT